MILTLAKINQSIDILGKLNTMPLPAKYAFRVTKLIKKIEEELKFYNESRMKVFDRYAKKTPEGGLDVSEKKEVLFETDEDKAKCMAELNDLLSTEIEINFEKIPIDKIGDATFTPSELVMMEDFFEE